VLASAPFFDRIQVGEVMENIHKGHRERLKTRFRNEGLDSFSEHEVLELILMYSIPQRDVNPLAHSLIREFGSLREVLKADYGQLIRAKGVGANTATLIKLVEESVRYADLKHDDFYAEKMSSSAAAGRFCIRLIGSERAECVAMLSLGADMKLIRAQIIQRGNFAQAPLYARHIVEMAIRNSAAAVILTHNHPSGVPEPSKEDVETTNSLKEALGVLDIALADHIIVTSKEYYSMFAKKHFKHAEEIRTSMMLASEILRYE
jgi:DNA repair protein RadC